MSDFPYVTRDEFDGLYDKISDASTRVRRLTDAMEKVRAPSKAHLIGAGSPAHGFGSDYQPGDFLKGITGMRDPATYQESKAILDDLGSGWEEPWGKATLGTTDATGGWIMPNAMVDTITKPGRYKPGVLDLVTIRPGVTSATVDVPFRIAAPSATVIAPWGDTKQNTDLVYNGYTATMYTLARIHDLTNQFVRHSAGAAEQDVMSELADAMRRGISTYLISGTGSSQPYGLKTALTNAPGTFTSSFTASGTTLAGSIATAIATAAGAMAGRDVSPTGAVLNSATYWTMLSQGTDSAGFFFNPAQGPEQIPGLRPGTLVTPFGIPLVPDSLLAADDLIVGDFTQVKVYQGQNFRIDSSSIAGSRWDDNLTGFRGEQEVGFDCRPAVYSGHFQLVEDVVPA